MFTVIKKYHTLHKKAGLKAAPEKMFFFLKKIKFLGHVISPERIQLIAKRVKDMKNLESPVSKPDVLKIFGCLGFYSCYTKNLHADSQPFYDISSTQLHSTGHTNTRNTFNQSWTELVEIRSLVCPQLSIFSTFTWIHRLLRLAVS